MPCSLTIRLSIDELAVVKQASEGRLSVWARETLVRAARQKIRDELEAVSKKRPKKV